MTDATTHCSNKELLDFLMGALDSRKMKAIADHLSCPVCQRQLGIIMGSYEGEIAPSVEKYFKNGTLE